MTIITSTLWKNQHFESRFGYRQGNGFRKRINGNVAIINGATGGIHMIDGVT